MTTGHLQTDMFAACRDCGGDVPLGRILARADRRVSDERDGDGPRTAYWDVEAPGICAACGSGRARVHFQI